MITVMYSLNDYNIVASYLWRKMQRDFASIVYHGSGMQIVAWVVVFVGLIVLSGCFLNRLFFKSRSSINAIDNVVKIKRILKICMEQGALVSLEIDGKKVATHLKITEVVSKRLALVCVNSRVSKLWIERIASCYLKQTDSKGEIVYRFTTTVVDVVFQERKLFLAMPKIIYFSRQ